MDADLLFYFLFSGVRQMWSQSNIVSMNDVVSGVSFFFVLSLSFEPYLLIRYTFFFNRRLQRLSRTNVYTQKESVEITEL